MSPDGQKYHFFFIPVGKIEGKTDTVCPMPCALRHESNQQILLADLFVFLQLLNGPVVSDRAAEHSIRSSSSMQSKKLIRHTPDGLGIEIFPTLLPQLATRCRNRYRMRSDPCAPGFSQLTELTPLKKKAFQLIGLYRIEGKLR